MWSFIPLPLSQLVYTAYLSHFIWDRFLESGSTKTRYRSIALGKASQQLDAHIAATRRAT